MAVAAHLEVVIEDDVPEQRFQLVCRKEASRASKLHQSDQYVSLTQ